MDYLVIFCFTVYYSKKGLDITDMGKSITIMVSTPSKDTIDNSCMITVLDRG